MTTELVRARYVGPGLYQLEEIPWFVWHLSLGDIVECQPADCGERQRYVRCQVRSGNITTVLYVVDLETARSLDLLLFRYGISNVKPTSRLRVANVTPELESVVRSLVSDLEQRNRGQCLHPVEWSTETESEIELGLYTRCPEREGPAQGGDVG